MKTSDLRNVLIRDGGFSFSAKGTQPSKGYMVSVKDVVKMSLADFVETEECSSVEKCFKLISKSPDNLYVGGWLDVKSGVVYIDISKNVNDINEAIKIAKKNNQLAIYDVANDNSIYIK